MFEYINKTYGLNVKINQRVIVDGKGGIIISDKGHYLGVNFDKDKAGVISQCHPTWNIEYLGIGKPRKLTKSQERGRRWLECGDMFESFMDFVRWDEHEQRKLK